MTDSMNFGPEWLRNLSSDGSTTGGTAGGARYQLSGYRYGREEMLGLYEKGFKPPASLFDFTTLYSEQPLIPLVLTPTTDEERPWPSRTPMMNSGMRGGRGTSLERGGRISRGRGSYQSYGRNVGSYESGGGWGNGEQSDWSPRKDYNYRSSSVDNWRRNRSEEDDDWRSNNPNRGPAEKWGRSTSWRDGDKIDERGGGGPQDRPRNWHENSRGHGQRRGWDEDLPEWATEHLGEGGGTFDSSGAYHGSDEEREQKRLTPNKKDTLQKSSSQHNISPKQPPLTTSKSAISLSKQREIDRPDDEKREPLSPPPLSKANHQDVRELRKQDPPEKQKSEADKISLNSCPKEAKSNTKHPEKRDPDDGLSNPIEMTNNNSNNSNSHHNGIVTLNATGSIRRVEEDFDRMQEDLVSKLVVEEESPKGPQLNSNINMPNVGTTPQPPPNLVPPIHDQWYYQDPQGDMQGPFVSTEMADWFKAGYFSNSLCVRRQCDTNFYTLGDLVRICNGNPFLTTVRIPPLKETAKIPEQELLNLHLLQAQLALRHVPPRGGYKPEWTSLSALQQRDLLSQQMLPPQMSPVDLQYLQQTAPPPAATNPLMHIINQMQQANKLPGQTIPDQPPNTMPVQLDPLQALVQQMHSLQRIQTPVSGIPGIGIPPNMQNENLVNNLSGLHGNLPGAGMPAPNLTGLSAPPVLQTPLPPKPPTLDGLANAADSDPINSLLRQLQNKQLQQTQQLDSLWQQNQYIQAQANSQWQQQSQPPATQLQPPPSLTQTPQQIQPTPEMPLSMWDIQQSLPTKPLVELANGQLAQPHEDQMEKEQSGHQQIQQSHQTAPSKDKEALNKDEKKKKEQEEKQAKKEAEDKKKQEQKRLEQEKKTAEEKRKKEEEKRKKEDEKLKKLLEKAKKEAEEKRQKELEEKRRLKELRKLEEEARKKADEVRKVELEQQEREKRDQPQQKSVEIVAHKASQDAGKVAKTAPWSQSNIGSGPSLADIQKAEREKRAEQVLLQQQQRAQQQQTLEQQIIEKPSSMHLSWANKPIQPRQVKSLAEIQAEEHERLAKQAAESRLAQQQKEKETGSTITSAGIWHGQNLTWANNPSTQWSSAAAGFWDDSSSQQHHHHLNQHETSVHKPSSVIKSNSTSAMTTTVVKPQTNKQPKPKAKKEESVTTKTSNGPATEEFTAWCTKALANINTTVDIPTFVGFLRDIESAADVKEYCREYLGDNSATHYFATQFLEKRRSFRPKAIAHKDDMCSPAPAITPNSQHFCDFQEVKGKAKKPKKSKMTKVDASRILGFSVTAAQDRINVGDRDYGENS